MKTISQIANELPTIQERLLLASRNTIDVDYDKIENLIILYYIVQIINKLVLTDEEIEILTIWANELYCTLKDRCSTQQVIRPILLEDRTQVNQE